MSISEFILVGKTIVRKTDMLLADKRKDDGKFEIRILLRDAGIQKIGFESEDDLDAEFYSLHTRLTQGQD